MRMVRRWLEADSLPLLDLDPSEPSHDRRENRRQDYGDYHFQRWTVRSQAAADPSCPLLHSLRHRVRPSRGEKSLELVRSQRFANPRPQPKWPAPEDSTMRRRLQHHPESAMSAHWKAYAGQCWPNSCRRLAPHAYLPALVQAYLPALPRLCLPVLLQAWSPASAWACSAALAQPFRWTH